MNIKDTISQINKKSFNKFMSDFLNSNNKVPILSKGGFKKVLTHLDITEDNVELSDYTFISILNTDLIGDNDGYLKSNKKNVLILNFDDVFEDSNKGSFTDKQALEIINFINENGDKIKNSKCVVHCSAGVSRSGAVGTFINDYFLFNSEDFKYFNHSIHPNKLVLDILKKVSD